MKKKNEQRDSKPKPKWCRLHKMCGFPFDAKITFDRIESTTNSISHIFHVFILKQCVDVSLSRPRTVRLQQLLTVTYDWHRQNRIFAFDCIGKMYTRAMTLTLTDVFVAIQKSIPLALALYVQCKQMHPMRIQNIESLIIRILLKLCR